MNKALAEVADKAHQLSEAANGLQRYCSTAEMLEQQLLRSKKELEHRAAAEIEAATVHALHLIEHNACCLKLWLVQ